MPKGSKVLMADDDKMLLDMYKERLELAGYVVQSFYNGEDAIAHVHDFIPDIIMLDVMMPKMNGYETLASLKSDPATKNIPVIMLSALMRDFNREKAVEGGAEDYLIKSEAMPSDVITKIEQVLQKFGKGSTPVPGAPEPSSQAENQVPSNPDVPPVVPVTPEVPPTTVEPSPETASLAGKVFTAPQQETGETLVFEPEQSATENNFGVSKEGESDVVKVTSIGAQPPVVASTLPQSDPEKPSVEDVNMEEVAKSNWILPLLIGSIVVLLVSGAIAFYFAFMK